MLTQCILILSKVLNAFKTNKLCDDFVVQYHIGVFITY